MSPVLLYAIGLAGLGGLYALDRLANRVVRPPILPPERSVPDLGLAHEPFRISSGGHELSAWLVHAVRDADAGMSAGADAGVSAGTGMSAGPSAGQSAGTGGPASAAAPEAPVVLLAHGWGASHGIVLRLADPLARMGCDVVLFDVRGHGTNVAVPYVTVRSFRDDVVAAVTWIRARFPTRPLVVVGHSFGGAAAVLAAAEGAPIDGLVLIATPSDVLRITAEFLTSKGMPGALMVTALRPFWWRRVGGGFGPLTPWRRIGELDQPLLIIQPEHDRRVARPHAERLAAAAAVDVHLVPERGHTDVLEAPITLELIRAFLERMREPGQPRPGPSPPPGHSSSARSQPPRSAAAS